MSSLHEPPALDNYCAVVAAFRDFLIVAIHTILYEREIYPRTSFLKARKYNYPVRQSRHPKVCKWVQDAVAAVEAEMLKCTISSTSLIILAPPPLSTPLERYAFQTSAFPRIPSSEQLTPFESPLPPAQNLPAQFAATISRLSTLSSTLAPLPHECSFTLVVELRDDSDALLGGSQPWIAADQNLQRRKGKGKEGGGLLDKGESIRDDLPGREVEKTKQDQQLAAEDKNSLQGEIRNPRQSNLRSTPVRNIEAGAFIMEVWVEEGSDKAAAIAAQAADEKRQDEERRGITI